MGEGVDCSLIVFQSRLLKKVLLLKRSLDRRCMMFFFYKKEFPEYISEPGEVEIIEPPPQEFTLTRDRLEHIADVSDSEEEVFEPMNSGITPKWAENLFPFKAKPMKRTIKYTLKV